VRVDVGGRVGERGGGWAVLVGLEGGGRATATNGRRRVDVGRWWVGNCAGTKVWVVCNRSERSASANRSVTLERARDSQYAPAPTPA
jgi:hypothetical protein